MVMLILSWDLGHTKYSNILDETPQFSRLEANVGPVSKSAALPLRAASHGCGKQSLCQSEHVPNRGTHKMPVLLFGFPSTNLNRVPSKRQ